jgi:muramoyltetrapeptide carboxypeptidase
MTSLTLYSPSGVLAQGAALKLSAKRLKALGLTVAIDESALAKYQRFAGDDDTRLATLHRIAAQAPSIAMATRGGYGLTRLLDRIDWPLLMQSIARGTRWVGYSDFTALQLGLLAHTKLGKKVETPITWAGPMACEDFGRSVADGGVDDVTQDCFLEAMGGELEAVGFRTEAGFDGLKLEGMLWGGNLCMVNSLLGTPHFPRIKGGVLFLEDVNEHPYRVERNLLQLHHAGVLDAQKAVVLGDFTGWRKSPLDRGYNLKSVVQHLRNVTKTPVLTGLPFGHVPTKVSLPVGARIMLVVQGREVLMGWEHMHHDQCGHGAHHSESAKSADSDHEAQH